MYEKCNSNKCKPQIFTGYSRNTRGLCIYEPCSNPCFHKCSRSKCFPDSAWIGVCCIWEILAKYKNLIQGYFMVLKYFIWHLVNSFKVDVSLKFWITKGNQTDIMWEIWDNTIGIWTDCLKSTWQILFRGSSLDALNFKPLIPLYLMLFFLPSMSLSFFGGGEEVGMDQGFLLCSQAMFN